MNLHFLIEMLATIGYDYLMKLYYSLVMVLIIVHD